MEIPQSLQAPVPVLNYPWRKYFFHDIQNKPPLFQFLIIVSHFHTIHHSEEPVCVFLMTSP